MRPMLLLVVGLIVGFVARARVQKMTVDRRDCSSSLSRSSLDKPVEMVFIPDSLFLGRIINVMLGEKSKLSWSKQEVVDALASSSHPITNRSADQALVGNNKFRRRKNGKAYYYQVTAKGKNHAIRVNTFLLNLHNEGQKRRRENRQRVTRPNFKVSPALLAKIPPLKNLQYVTLNLLVPEKPLLSTKLKADLAKLNCNCGHKRNGGFAQLIRTLLARGFITEGWFLVDDVTERGFWLTPEGEFARWEMYERNYGAFQTK